MAALSTSPRPHGSLLIPTNPAFSPPDLHPRGGILLNAGESSTSPRHRLSDSLSTPPAFNIPLPGTPSPKEETPPSLGKPRVASTSSATKPPRIRFAPLPDPNRPRSLSTGRNVAWTGEGMDGERHFEIRGIENQQVVYDDDESSDDEIEDEERDKRGRSWSKSMSWKGTKSLLTTGKLPPKRDDKDSADEGYSSGASLKKSISTGGMIGSSPFRWTAEDNRRKSMQGGLGVRGTSPGGAGHRRNSSLEPGANALGSSAPVVKMLNGRVYGSRRASEIAEFQRKTREKMEPAFVEWGHGKTGSGLGSNAPKTGGGGVLDEEGSGMEWVRKRREERQRKQREEAEARLREAGSQSAPEDDRKPPLSSSQSSGESPLQTAITPAIRTTDLPPTPRIEVSEHGTSPVNKFAPEGVSPVVEKREPELAASSSGTQAIDIAPPRIIEPHDHFPNRSPGDGDGDDEEEDDEDDGDFSPDEEEDELEEDISRTTAAAAGREVISRHHE